MIKRPGKLESRYTRAKKWYREGWAKRMEPDERLARLEELRIELRNLDERLGKSTVPARQKKKSARRRELVQGKIDAINTIIEEERQKTEEAQTPMPSENKTSRKAVRRQQERLDQISQIAERYGYAGKGQTTIAEREQLESHLRRMSKLRTLETPDLQQMKKDLRKQRFQYTNLAESGRPEAGHAQEAIQFINSKIGEIDRVLSEKKEN